MGHQRQAQVAAVDGGAFRLAVAHKPVAQVRLVDVDVHGVVAPHHFGRDDHPLVFRPFGSRGIVHRVAVDGFEQVTLAGVAFLPPEDVGVAELHHLVVVVVVKHLIASYGDFHRAAFHARQVVAQGVARLGPFLVYRIKPQAHAFHHVVPFGVGRVAPVENHFHGGGVRMLEAQLLVLARRAEQSQGDEVKQSFHLPPPFPLLTLPRPKSHTSETSSFVGPNQWRIFVSCHT